MRTALLLTMLALSPAAVLAQAVDADAELAAIREQVLYASYPDAIAQAQALLARTDLDATQRNTALELLATAQIADQQADAARATLALLYARDPGFRLTDADASPPVISAFARARESHPDPVRVTISHSSPGTLAHRESPQITVQILDGADAVGELRMSYRHATDAGYSRVVLDRRADGSYVGHIPVIGAADQAIDVAYYLTATSPSGSELAHLGTEAQPLALRIPGETADVAVAGPPIDAAPARGGDVTSEPWFWILLGVVVAGAGVGIGFGVDAATRGPEPGTLGVVTLTM